MDNEYKGQIYAAPTADPIFKMLLRHVQIREDFLHCFLPDLKFTKTTVLDEHMNPLKTLQRARKLIKSPKTKEVINVLSKAQDIEVRVAKRDREKWTPLKNAGLLLKGIVKYYDDFEKAFPDPQRDSRMDFLCQLDTGDLVLVEMQVMPENQGDLRFLSYAAGVYSNQLKRGGKTKDIKKVIAINLLGCGLQGTPHWKDAPDEFIRHYKFQEQLGPKKRLIEGIELIQWDLVNTPEDLERYIKDPNLREWILFFKRGHAMTRQQVKENFKNPNVQRAFTLIDYDTLSPELRAGCESLDEFFGKYSDYTESVMREGIEKGIEKGIAERLEIKVAEQVKIKLAEQVEIKVAQEKIKVEEQVEVKVAQQVEMRAREERLNIVKRMLGAGVSDDLILEATKISPAELLELKNRTS